jgi:hypothetical protein
MSSLLGAVPSLEAIGGRKETGGCFGGFIPILTVEAGDEFEQSIGAVSPGLSTRNAGVNSASLLR